MENFKIEAEAFGNIITLSALMETKKIIEEDGFRWFKKSAEIKEIASYLHTTEGEATKVSVIKNYQGRVNEIPYTHLPREQK